MTTIAEKNDVQAILAYVKQLVFKFCQIVVQSRLGKRVSTECAQEVRKSSDWVSTEPRSIKFYVLCESQLRMMRNFDGHFCYE